MGRWWESRCAPTAGAALAWRRRGAGHRGVGRLYAHTPTHRVTGDGLAMAARAGSHLADLEFVQFHPTALATGRDPMPLLTERCGRGGGAGRRSASAHGGEHPDAELARGIGGPGDLPRRQDGGSVYLDATSVALFPSGSHGVRAVHGGGIDPRREPVPVAPAATTHGRVAATWTASSLPAVAVARWPAAACTGQPAASNSCSRPRLRAASRESCDHEARTGRRGPALAAAAVRPGPRPKSRPMVTELRR